MDLKSSEEDTNVGNTEKSNAELGGLGTKAKGVGSVSSKDMFFRADRIDLKSLDFQIQKHLSRAWSRDAERPKEEWEIDLSKLNIKNVIAHGTYGIVYRGVYDGQDVAGKHDFLSIFLFLSFHFGF